jgi:hypothetical protein
VSAFLQKRPANWIPPLISDVDQSCRAEPPLCGACACSYCQQFDNDLAQFRSTTESTGTLLHLHGEGAIMGVS